MLPTINVLTLPPMAWHIQHDLDPHGFLLAIRQVSISARILSYLCLVHIRYPVRIHGNQLILFVPMSHIIRPPVASLWVFGPEETEATVALCVRKASIKIKALSYRGLHLRHSKRRGRIDVRSQAVRTMRDESAIVHAAL